MMISRKGLGYCGIRHAPSKADRQFVFPTEFGVNTGMNQTSLSPGIVGNRRIQSRCFGNGGFVTGYGRIPATVEPSLLDFLEPAISRTLASAHDCPAGSGRNLTGQNLQPERSAVDQLSLQKINLIV